MRMPRSSKEKPTVRHGHSYVTSYHSPTAQGQPWHVPTWLWNLLHNHEGGSYCANQCHALKTSSSKTLAPMGAHWSNRTWPWRRWPPFHVNWTPEDVDSMLKTSHVKHMGQLNSTTLLPIETMEVPMKISPQAESEWHLLARMGACCMLHQENNLDIKTSWCFSLPESGSVTDNILT